MRRFSFVWICALLITAAACSSTTSDSGGGEISSEADVQQLFEAVMPELIDALTELADQQFASKQGDDSSVQCPGGGAIQEIRPTLSRKWKCHAVDRMVWPIRADRERARPPIG